MSRRTLPSWMSSFSLSRTVSTVSFVSRDDAPAQERDAEARIYELQVSGKPENVRERIVAGKLDAWFHTVVLLELEMHNPKFEGRTVQQLRDDLTAKTGENVVIRRFARFAIGDTIGTDT